MKNILETILIVSIATVSTAFGQTVTSIPNDTANDRFLIEYHSVIRPGLSLNGFDNTGSTSNGLGLKQILNSALAGDVYLKDKLRVIFSDADNSLENASYSDAIIEFNSRIIQYTAFEALASYVLEHNGIDTSQSRPLGLNIRTHEDAIADLRAKLIFISELNSSGGFHGIYHFQINTWFHMITG